MIRNIGAFYGEWVPKLVAAPTSETAACGATALNPDSSDEPASIAERVAALDAKSSRVLRAAVSGAVQAHMMKVAIEHPIEPNAAPVPELASCVPDAKEKTGVPEYVDPQGVWKELHDARLGLLNDVYRGGAHRWMHEHALPNVLEGANATCRELTEWMHHLDKRVATERAALNRRIGESRSLPTPGVHGSFIGALFDLLDVVSAHMTAVVADFMVYPTPLRKEYLDDFATTAEGLQAWCLQSASFFGPATYGSSSRTGKLFQYANGVWRQCVVGATTDAKSLAVMTWKPEKVAEVIGSHGLCPAQATADVGDDQTPAATAARLAWQALVPLWTDYMLLVADSRPLSEPIEQRTAYLGARLRDPI